MIRTKILHGKVDILLIDGLPEDTKIHSLEANITSNGVHGTTIYKDGNSIFIPLPPGNWQPINWLDIISEDEAKELVEVIVSSMLFGYKNYGKFPKYITAATEPTAKESLLSLVESEVKIKNTFPPEWAIERFDEWQAEEKEVWKNIYLLKRI